LIVQAKWIDPLMNWRLWAGPIVTSIVLLGVAQYDYLTFHTLAELFAITVSFVLFALAWTTYDFSKNAFLIFLACGYFWVGSIDLMHALTFEGMNLFLKGNTNLAVQFWLSARFLEATVLLAASFLPSRKPNKYLLVALFGVIAAVLIGLIATGMFPVGFVDGQGLTVFKTWSEYAIIFILFVALVALIRNETNIQDVEKSLIVLAIVMTMFAELAFTAYTSASGPANLIGHILKLFSFWLIFNAVVSTNLRNPYTALIENEKRFRDFAESASDWFWEQDADLRFTSISVFRENSFAEFAQGAIGHTRWGWVGIDLTQDERWRRHAEALKAHLSFRDFQYSVPDGNGKTIALSVSGRPVFDDEGTFTGYRGTVTDITDLIDARRTSDRFFNALEYLPAGLALWDADGRFVMANDHYQKLVAPSSPYLEEGITYEGWVRVSARQGTAPEARGREEEWVAERLEHFDTQAGAPEVLRGNRWQQMRFLELPDGSKLQIVEDIHDLKLSEEKLRQSQRLEAVGHLTSGVAHDFNNLLAAIIGNAELLANRIEDSEDAQRNIKEIRRAIDRGSSLTHRLLAFSRQQRLSPELSDINRLVFDFEEMLQRTLGETIELVTRSGSKSCSALIDSHQFLDSLLNLAINARDAMPEGGTLVIDISCVTVDKADARGIEGVSPGNYVNVAVKDSGSGMPPEILEKVFDPFFTTKEVGAGSGLGLSMVYGFARQSKGYVTVESKVGYGTTVNLLLPRSNEMAVEDAGDSATSVSAPGSESVLVVEDEQSVREVTVYILQDQGYEIVSAMDGKEALRHLNSGKTFDLLFTDIILPGGVNGIELAKQALQLQPGIGLLFTSGYADTAVIREGKLNTAENTIRKPYTRKELLEKVRDILNLRSEPSLSDEPIARQW